MDISESEVCSTTATSTTPTHNLTKAWKGSFSSSSRFTFTPLRAPAITGSSVPYELIRVPGDRKATQTLQDRIQSPWMFSLRQKLAILAVRSHPRLSPGVRTCETCPNSHSTCCKHCDKFLSSLADCPQLCARVSLVIWGFTVPSTTSNSSMVMEREGNNVTAPPPGCTLYTCKTTFLHDLMHEGWMQK